MSALRLLLAIAVLALGLAPAAEAAELFSPALLAPGNGGFACTAVNVGSAPRIIAIEVCALTGSCLGGNPAELDPGQGGSVTVPVTAASLRYCKVTVEGGKSTVRTSFTAFDANGVATGTVELN